MKTRDQLRINFTTGPFVKVVPLIRVVNEFKTLTLLKTRQLKERERYLSHSVVALASQATP